MDCTIVWLQNIHADQYKYYILYICKRVDLCNSDIAHIGIEMTTVIQFIVQFRYTFMNIIMLINRLYLKSSKKRISLSVWNKSI